MGNMVTATCPAAIPLLMRLLALCLLFSRVTLADITCGDGRGATSSNWFNKLRCGSFNEGVYGAACADDFNVWCCPRNYGCDGSFRDPGGNDHCQNSTKFSGDCTYCPNQPDKILKTPLGVCLNTQRYGKCHLELGNFQLNQTDFVVPDTSTGCKFYCCPAHGQYCIDEGCVRETADKVQSSPQQAVYDHVRDNANKTFREPSGILKYKFLVPSGPYQQLWDWDSFFMGVAMFEFGSAPYLEGSMMNFLDHTNVSTGEVQGCLQPSGPSGVIFQAKPVVIQGAWLASQRLGTTGDFRRFHEQMKAMLRYWSSETRTHAPTGLPKWYNQLESGQDNLVLSTCASSRSACWDPRLHELVLVSADLATFLFREYTAYALFCEAWAEAAPDGDPDRASLEAERLRALAVADSIKRAVNIHLWDEGRGFYTALNTSSAPPLRVVNRVDVMGFPLWAGIADPGQASRLRSELLAPDMLSKFGIRSTSAADARYNNKNEIKPYSNWQGPVWVNANAVLTLGLRRYGYVENATRIAASVVRVLAADLSSTGTWHEGYNSETGQGLAARGFLSWDTLGATWPSHVSAGTDPFALARDA